MLATFEALLARLADAPLAVDGPGAERTACAAADEEGMVLGEEERSAAMVASLAAMLQVQRGAARRVGGRRLQARVLKSASILPYFKCSCLTPHPSLFFPLCRHPRAWRVCMLALSRCCVSGLLRPCPLLSLQRFDETWVAYLEQFVAWKSADAGRGHLGVRGMCHMRGRASFRPASGCRPATYLAAPQPPFTLPLLIFCALPQPAWRLI